MTPIKIKKYIFAAENFQCKKNSTIFQNFLKVYVKFSLKIRQQSDNFVSDLRRVMCCIYSRITLSENFQYELSGVTLFIISRL
jgi:hypothetical protein